MMMSEARIRANQANASKSTVPRTAIGKERSRKNAIKHLLCAEIVGFEGPESFRERAGGFAGSPGSSPSADFHFGEWLFNQVSTLGLRIEQAQAMQEAARERSCLRAGLAWEDDRRLEAVLLGGQLAGRGRPDQVLEKLRQTPQGCEWLMAQWALLARAADEGRGWTAEQATLAFNLLGTPREFREGNIPGADLAGAVAPPSELARRQIADLERRRDLARELDAADRKRAEAGLLDDAEIRRLRRYETALERRFRWTFELLREASDSPKPPATEEPDPDQGLAPQTEAEPPSPPALMPATPEAFSIGKTPQRPVREPSRAERRLMKADSRREAKRRKLEELRA